MLDASPVRPTILLVEDDEAERAAMALLLERSGYAVVQAGGAYEALRAGMRARPDLAIVDVVLPDSSGVDVTRAMHAISATAALPVVVVTAHAEAVRSLDPRSFGAACLLLKPVTEAALLDAVARCLAGAVAPEAPATPSPRAVP